MNLCKDCKHYYENPRPDFRTESLCDALRGKEHPVHGTDITAIKADIMRMVLCGWSDPKFFEPKDAR